MKARKVGRRESMKTKNVYKPAFVPGWVRPVSNGCWRRTIPKHSGIFTIIGIMGRMGVIGKITENRSVEPYSEMSNLGIGRIGLMGPMGLMGRKSGKQSCPGQRDSGISIFKTCPYRPYRPYCPLYFKTSPAQRNSKMSNRRLSGVSYWPHGGRLSGVLCCPHGQTSHAQPDSGISNLRFCPLCPFCLSCPLVSKITPAQLDSGISILLAWDADIVNWAVRAGRSTT